MTTSIQNSQPAIAQSSSWTVYQAAVSQSRTWFFVLTALGAMSNVLYTCTVPLVGFSAIAGTTLSRRKAISTIFSLWVVNQAIGFTLRQYPWTFSTFAWGGVMLLGAIIVTILVSMQTQTRCKGALYLLSQIGVTLVSGYLIYELIIWLAGFMLGGVSGFTLSILWQIFMSNAIWAIGLTIIYCLLVWRLMRFAR
jgi:hypothetical protein